MTHPLDDAYAQLDGAREDLKRLKEIELQILSVEGYPVTADVDQKTGDYVVRVQQGRVDIDNLAYGRLVGTIIDSLRKPLNYLVYRLALLDSPGEKSTGTQFPIEDTPKGFAGKRKVYLKGVNDAHVAGIEQLQPYGMNSWMRQVRILSNPDKHETIHRAILGGMPARVTGSQSITESTQPHRLMNIGRRVGVRPWMGRQVNVNIQFTALVQFEDGSPVVHTLEILETCVRQVIDSFKPEFEPPGQRKPPAPPTEEELRAMGLDPDLEVRPPGAPPRFPQKGTPEA